MDPRVRKDDDSTPQLALPIFVALAYARAHLGIENECSRSASKEVAIAAVVALAVAVAAPGSFARPTARRRKSALSQA
jgi:hypothetical protein